MASFFPIKIPGALASVRNPVRRGFVAVGSCTLARIKNHEAFEAPVIHIFDPLIAH